MIGDGLQYGALCGDRGILFAVGYLAGNIYFEVSDDDGESPAEFIDGTTRKQISAGDAEQPGIEILGSGEIVVSLVNEGTLEHHTSSNFGESWSEIG